MDMSVIKDIYNRLQDQKSKEIFDNWLLYGFTGDYSHIIRMIRNTEAGQEIFAFLQRKAKKPKIIFGCGGAGDVILDSFPDIAWECFADNHYTGIEKRLPVVSADSLVQDYPDAAILVTPIRWHCEIVEQLLKAGFSQENILNVGSMIEDLYRNQYFDTLPVMQNGEELFVDGGCYDGATALNFIGRCGGRYRKILAFEPDKTMFDICSKNLAGLRGFVLRPYGLWNQNTQLRFIERADGTSTVSTCEKCGENETMLEAVSLDQIADGEQITFIKLDIEGSELNALKGAKNIIQKQKPKLAVCIYHNSEDVWKIPGLLLEYNPGYVFYIRHYSLSWNETVLYAVEK